MSDSIPFHVGGPRTPCAAGPFILLRNLYHRTVPISAQGTARTTRFAFRQGIILLCATLLHAATPADVPALEQKLATASAAERPALLLALAEAAELSDFARAFAAAKEAHALARDPHRRLAALAVVASMTRDIPDYPEAQRLAREGLAQATAAKDERLQARFHYILARTEWSTADFAAAVTSFHEAIRLGEHAGDDALLVDAHTGIAVVYLDFGELDSAEPHVEAARRCTARLNDPARIANFDRIHGILLSERKDFVGARAAYEHSRQISAQSGERRREADALTCLAAIDDAEGHFDDALARDIEAIAIYEKLGLKRPQANAYRQRGRTLGRMGRTAEALQHLETSRQLASDVGMEVGLAELYRERALVHEAAGDLQAALNDRREQQIREEKIFSERSRQQLAVLTARNEAMRRQQEIDLLKREQSLENTELARVHWQRYALLGAMLLGGVGVTALVGRQRARLAAERRVLAETRAAHAAAEEAGRLKTTLLGLASHGLRSPLAAMVARAEEIARHSQDAARTRALSTELHLEGERLLALVRDLLDLSALESGRVQLARAPCDLAAIATAAVEAHRSAADARRQSLVCSPTTPAVVSADAARLAQVFDQLLGHAMKVTPAGGTIAVSVNAVGRHATAQVRDSGPGLAPGDFARLFQPFQSLSGQSGDDASSGLGLFIAREMITLHGGTLGVDSTPGEGTTFMVELPIAAPE